MLSSSDTAALLVAGTAAGLVGSAGGITSLVSYPALLAVGLPALSATVANNIALVACWPGSALASRRELRGRAGWLGRWTLIAALAGSVGAALLVLTPAGAFARVVPFLVLTGALALLFEPRLTAWRQGRGHADGTFGLLTGVAAASVYNGYFGAGAGVMVLTLMLVLVDRDLGRANALKNMLIGASSLSSAAVLAVTAVVAWSAVVPLAVGMLIGSNLGPRVARRVPARLLRFIIAALGVVLAVRLWVHPQA